MKNSIDNNTTSTPFPKEQLLQDIKEFLELQSKGLSFTDIYKESMKNQGYFTATDEQFKDSNWKPDSTKGLDDNSYIFIPTAKVGQTLGTSAKEVSPVIIQKSGQVYDDVTLGAIQGINKVAPNLTNKYLKNPSIYIQGVDDIITSILPGIPANTKIGVSAFGLYELYNRDKETIIKIYDKNYENFKGIYSE